MPSIFILPSLILVVGVIDDLRSQKVHNWLTVSAMAVALVVNLVFFGTSALTQGLLAGGLAFALTFPLFLAKILGGGDVKLMMAFGFAADINAVYSVLLYSLFWGALLGVVHAILNGQAMKLIQNTLAAATLKSKDTTQLNKIPYTVALLFGWLTHLTLLSLGLGL